MTTPELPRESHDPSHTEPIQVKNSMGHPIHPTTSTSTPAQDAVDGSNDIDQIRHSLGIAERELTGIPYTPPEVVIAWARPLAAMVRRLLDEIGTTTKAADPTCSRTDHLTSSCDHNATDVRPVVPVVARVLDLDELDRFVAAGEWLPPGDVRPLVAEVRRLREVVSGWAANLGSASGRISELETELDADRKAIGVLGAAVGKVSELHRDDGDGFCTACRTTAWPCATAAAIGVGQ